MSYPENRKIFLYITLAILVGVFAGFIPNELESLQDSQQSQTDSLGQGFIRHSYEGHHPQRVNPRAHENFILIEPGLY